MPPPARPSTTACCCARPAPWTPSPSGAPWSTRWTAPPARAFWSTRAVSPSPTPTDTWAREDKAGLGYTIKGVRYFRWEIGDQTLHEIGLMPAKMVVAGTDLLAGINAALGR
ncbi:phage major tail tube protein [Roseospira marina]|uniref:phage major tail tube protein n=1 Tax=Roseospira marina TaxID=140057 RepID=UPI0014783C6E|nr:phage major tail tube protein [Roseospira marina]